MKIFTATTLLLTLFVVNACTPKSDEVTHMPPLPTNEITVPPTTVAPSTTVAQMPAGASCSPQDMNLYCGDPLWFGLPKCGPGSADGNIYFKDVAAVVAQDKAHDTGSCIWVDGKNIPGVDGFGPCIPCVSRITAGQVKALAVGKTVPGGFPEVDRSIVPGSNKK